MFGKLLSTQDHVAPLVMRVILGGVFLPHGAQKVLVIEDAVLNQCNSNVSFACHGRSLWNCLRDDRCDYHCPS